MQLSHNEYLIMALLWKENRPLSRAEILKGTEGRNWNPASIHLILNSMLSKGVIKITDEEKKYGRTYEAVITQEDHVLNCLDESIPEGTIEEKLIGVYNVLAKKVDEKKLMGLVAALVDRTKIKEKDIEALEAILEEKRKEIKSRKKK
jgi:predicted transcriptional regulator